MKLKKLKTGPGRYLMLNKKNLVIAEIVKTGTRRDNYPWEWHLEVYVSFGEKDGKRPRPHGTCQTLKECVDVVESRAKQYGVEMEMVETDGNSTQPA